MREPAYPFPELLLSPEHPCPYLPDKTARTLFLDPRASALVPYGVLLAQGFRRSGAYFYRPRCHGCQACIPLRIPVNEFQPDRNQRRTWNHNRDLSLTLRAAEYSDEHFDLYLRYQRWKHPAGGMDQSSSEDYSSFLLASSGETLMIELRLHHELLAVAIMDVAGDAASAVYTFYSPDVPRRSLGTYSVLREIEQARNHHLRWLYLGYWISTSPKMAYKSRFLPHEILTIGGWQHINRTRP